MDIVCDGDISVRLLRWCMSGGKALALPISNSSTSDTLPVLRYPRHSLAPSHAILGVEACNRFFASYTTVSFGKASLGPIWPQHI